MESVFFNENELCDYLDKMGISMSVHKVRKDRLRGVGFPWHKINGKIFYKKEDIHNHINQSRIIPKRA